MTKASNSIYRAQTFLRDSACACLPVHHSSAVTDEPLGSSWVLTVTAKAQGREKCLSKRSVVIAFSNGVGLTELHRKPAKCLRKLYQQNSLQLNLKATESGSPEHPISPWPCLSPTLPFFLHSFLHPSLPHSLPLPPALPMAKSSECQASNSLCS